MKATVLALVVACSLAANAQPVKLEAGDACPDARPALFLPNADAIRVAGELEAARAERDALKASHLDGRKVAALVIATALAGIAAGVGVGVAASEAGKR